MTKLPDYEDQEYVLETVGDTTFVRRKFPDGRTEPVYDLDADGNPTIEHVYRPNVDDWWLGIFRVRPKTSFRPKKRKHIPMRDLINIIGKPKLTKQGAKVKVVFHFPDDEKFKGEITVPLPKQKGIVKRIKKQFPQLSNNQIKKRTRQFLLMWIEKQLVRYYRMKEKKPKEELFELPSEIRVDEL